MRRIGLTVLGVFSLLVTATGPVAAFVPDPGRYRYIDVSAYDCVNIACDVYNIYDVYAETHQDGSTDVCVFFAAVDLPTPTNEYQDFGCNTTPPAFTYDGNFIVGVPNTSVDLYSYYPAPVGVYHRTVSVSVDVSLVGRPDRHTETSTEVSGNCTTRLTARYQVSDIAGTFTVDSLLTAGNYNPISSQVSDYSVKTVCK
jgi:hypothetical protein